MTKEDEKQVRCNECIHHHMCGRVMEIFGRQYAVDYCSLGEKEKKDENNRHES